MVLQNPDVFFSVGRRKESSAVIYLKKGDGKMFVNNKDLSSYFYMNSCLISEICRPLKVLNLEGCYDLFIRVKGGGYNSQAESICLGISKALLKVDDSHRASLKAFSLLKRRKVNGKERKKIGRKAARKSPQWRKR